MPGKAQGAGRPCPRRNAKKEEKKKRLGGLGAERMAAAKDDAPKTNGEWGNLSHHISCGGRKKEGPTGVNEREGVNPTPQSPGGIQERHRQQRLGKEKNRGAKGQVPKKKGS